MLVLKTKLDDHSVWISEESVESVESLDEGCEIVMDSGKRHFVKESAGHVIEKVGR